MSIPFFEDNWTPCSFFDKIIENYKRNLHTLCLLDIKIREKDFDHILSSTPVYLPKRYDSSHLVRLMNSKTALSQLALTIEITKSDCKKLNII